MNSDLLLRLCAAYGIATQYRDTWGATRSVPIQTQSALLEAMGLQLTSDDDIQKALTAREEQHWRRLLPPVHVARAGESELPIAMALPETYAGLQFEWTLVEEGGGSRSGNFKPRDLSVEGKQRIAGADFVRVTLKLTELPGPGYHSFKLHVPGQALAPRATMRLIVVPQRCYLPASLKGARVWGLTVNLYGIRSQRNWGMGDFTDLLALLELAAQSGAALVGVNPLHALFPHDPDHASPYSPSSRTLINILYLDPERVPDFSECVKARESATRAEFQAELRALRAADLVDYRRTAKLKFDLMEMLFDHFCSHHLDSGTDRELAFRVFQQAGGDALRRASLFFTLQEELSARDATAWGWRAWPQQFRDPGCAEVSEFARLHARRIEYYDYLQWNAETQLDAVATRARELQLAVGLYQDLAVGADPGGPETWGAQGLYANHATIGAPPDEFNLRGQDWSMPPFVPERLQEAAYEPFITLLRANMRHAGALRIDHVMGLMRLFWVPANDAPDRGGYVSYPVDDLLGIVALESERNRCIVIGEDLGTLPDGFAERLQGWGILSYRLLYFQRESDGAFSPPAHYPPQSLAAVSTHDLPTLRAFWLGNDLDLRVRLNLYVSDQQHQQQVVQRAQDRARLLVALDREKLLPPGITVHPVSAQDMTPELALAVHRFLSRAPCIFFTVQPENIFGELEQVNVPATTGSQYANWRRKSTLGLERWGEEPRFVALVAALNEERGPPAPPRRLLATRIPEVTYRLQFNHTFTFAQAEGIVPYLHDLGISHCYASPYFSARPGSMHGYDIVDHNSFNPEIGSAEDFERFWQALRSRNMGQILDMVPNHVGVMGADNAWWLDVLENGSASAYAAYFDIDWESPRPELRGKLLLPVLGDHYGVVLEAAELHLKFDRAAGSFSVFYKQHRFPLDPAEYPYVLNFGLDKLKPRLGSDFPPLVEFEALVTSFGHLPPRDADDPKAVVERQRDKEVHKRQLARLCERSPDLLSHIEEAVRAINGEVGRPESFDALDALLARQAYRLAYWRVAAEEINYRRFFDINDLAALRMEDPRVFEATHRLVFRLLDEGKVDGIRIDHPDGLFDPPQYFRRLQERYLPSPTAHDARDLRSKDKPVYVVIEKILAEHERLSEHWPVYGTTGYRFANVVNGLFVNTAAEQQFSRIYRAFIGERLDYEEQLYQAKLLIMYTALAAELNVLANRLSRIARADRHTRDFTLYTLRAAIATVAASFPVYRTYVSGTADPEDRRYIEWAVAVARKRNRAIDFNVLKFVSRVLTGDAAQESPESRKRELLDFAMRFQQFTAPVAAKGMEDTVFYRYNRLVSLNEVGGDPRTFGFSLSAFHHASLDRARHWSTTMLATSTHDSKRSEDVRARIDALTEFPDQWWSQLQRWRRINRRYKRQIESAVAPDANDEYFIYQTLLGTWPCNGIDAETLVAYRTRIESYMRKAMRESKAHTTWMNVNEDYESAAFQFLAGMLDPSEHNVFLAEFAPFARRVARIGMFNSLSRTVIKIASPGVPDFYQGSEFWDLSLVDPDNRLPVDYRRRSTVLAELKAQFSGPPEQQADRARALLDHMEDGTIKLFVTWKGLMLRRQLRSLFAVGDYVPLQTQGVHADRLCAFARIHGTHAAIVAAPRLVGELIADGGLPLGQGKWVDTCIVLPDHLAGNFRNVYTQEQIACSGPGVLKASEVLRAFPVALMSRSEDTSH